METINAHEFREAMSKLAGAVSVVTTAGEAGKGGITVSAVVSVSDNPATLLVCVNTNNALTTMIPKNGVFAVNVLGKDGENLSNRFAGMDKVSMEDRFLVGNWETLITVSPLLSDSLVSFDCKFTDAKEVGTHQVIFGEVVGVKINTSEGNSKALLYFDRAYRVVG